MTGCARGLGWLIGADDDIIGISGGGPGAFASLLVPTGSPDQTCAARVALTNRRLPIHAVNVRVLRDRLSGEVSWARSHATWTEC